MADATDAYSDEIRSWLLGRLARQRTSGPIPAQPATRLPHPPVLFWWIFEGRRYKGLDDSLCQNWATIDRHARRLLVSYNPTWRLVDTPEGETDWIASSFHTLTAGRPVFVSKASKAGLRRNERDALLGWLEWLRQSWADYCSWPGPPDDTESVPWSERPEKLVRADHWCLRRWAHTAKRSRWPLLRNVVAESLRCLLEPQELNKLPLPENHGTLFEILCMVRILRAFNERPRHIRWLHLETGRNRVEIPGLTYFFQKSLDKRLVLSTPEFGNGLHQAMKRHRLRTPSTIDGWLNFTEPRNGFGGILVEAKSGSQSPDKAVYQLKCYRAAVKELDPRPLLVWGIVEEPMPTEVQASAFETLDVQFTGPPTGDTWVFSTADEITKVLAATRFVCEPSTRLKAAS